MISVKSSFLKVFNSVGTAAATFLLLASVGIAAEPARIYELSGSPSTKSSYQFATEVAARRLCDQAYELIAREQYEQAIDRLEGALTLAPNLANAHANIGLVFNRLGETSRAIEHLRTAVRLAPREPAPLLTLASAYQRIGRLHEACCTYQRFLSLFPHDSEVPVVRGLLSGLKLELLRIASVHRVATTNYTEYATSGTNIRWNCPSRVLNVFVAEAPTRQLKEALNCAFEKWQTVGCFSFRYTTEAAKADIICQWVDRAEAMANPAEGGEAKLTYKAGTIRRATLSLLTTRGNRAATVHEVGAVALHEVGHCLGIVGHSPSPDDVMYFSIHSDIQFVKYPTLSNRDIETLRTMYPAELPAEYAQCEPAPKTNQQTTDLGCLLNQGRSSCRE